MVIWPVLGGSQLSPLAVTESPWISLDVAVSGVTVRGRAAKAGPAVSRRAASDAEPATSARQRVVDEGIRFPQSRSGRTGSSLANSRCFVKDFDDARPRMVRPGGGGRRPWRGPRTLVVRDAEPHHRDPGRARALPPRAHGLLLPHARIGLRGRRRRPGDDGAGMEGRRSVRGTLERSVVA